MKWIVGTLALTGVLALGAEVVTLAWDEVAEPTVSGYRLYAGTNSRSYFLVTNVVGRANTTGEVAVPFPAFWYFAATATTAAGLESAYSGEVCAPVLPQAPQIHSEPFVRLIPMAERSTNLLTWEPIKLEPTLLPATNAQEFFRVTGIGIESLRMIK
jgi:hypothetical protein